MMLLLLAAGLILRLMYGSWLILILFFVFVAVAIGALLFYIYTAYKGWELEYEKTNIAEIVMTFGQDTNYIVKLLDAEGKIVSIDELDLQLADKVAFLKGKTYLFQGAATMYYLTPADFTGGDYEKFREKLALNLEPQKFKMKTKRKTFPRPIIK